MRDLVARRDDAWRRRSGPSSSWSARSSRLQPGERVLDVGCGWGSFAMHAAREHGVHVTGHHAVRAAGVAGARARARGRAGGPDRHPRDGLPRARGRAVRRDRLDRHGRARRQRQHRRVLREARVAGAAGRADPQPRDRAAARRRRRSRPVLGALRVPGRGAAAPVADPDRGRARRACTPRHVEDFPEDYARTLLEWQRRFEANIDRARELAGDERVRVWRIYLRVSRQGFESGFMSPYQVRRQVQPKGAGPFRVVSENPQSWAVASRA